MGSSLHQPAIHRRDFEHWRRFKHAQGCLQYAKVFIDRPKPMWAARRAVATDKRAQVARAWRKHDYSCRAESFRASALMTMKPSDALQHYIHRRDIGQHQIGVEVEALLDRLRRCGHARRGRGFAEAFL